MLTAAVLATVLGFQPQWIAPASPSAVVAPSWIWAKTNPPATVENAPEGEYLFSKTVKVRENGTVVEVRGWLAADNQAKLRMNNTDVVESTGWSAPAFARIAPPKFEFGQIDLAIWADNNAVDGKRPTQDPAGVCACIEIEYADGFVDRIMTDDSWSSLHEPGMARQNELPYSTSVVLGPSTVAPWGIPASAFAAPTTCPRFRKVLTLGDTPTTAPIRIVGLGHYELRCNGQVVGDSVINQAWSQYDKTLYTQTFDLAPYLKKGENVLAVTLGNSFWSVGPVNDTRRFSKTDAMPDFSAGEPFLLWIDGEAKVGATTVPIVTDATWTAGASPLTFSHIYAGEDFDASLDLTGWDTATAAPGKWTAARIAKKPSGELVPLASPPIKTFETFKPIEIKTVDPSTHTYIFPQNCSSLLRFTVSGSAGQRVRFKPCEYMQADGRVKFTYTWGTGKDIWHDYTLRGSGGGGEESHQTVFCYVGAQYVQVEGAVPEGSPNPSGLPVLRSLELVHTRAACPTVGTFATGDRIQDGAFRLIDWSIKTNMAHVPTDCPHREKNGWLEQNWHMARAMSYRYDIHSYFTKVSRDMRDAQIAGGEDDGFVPTNAPWYLVGRPRHDTYNDAPEWGVSAVLVPWHLYEWYGDTAVLESNFASMKRFVDYLGRTAKDGLITSNLGDWYDYGHGKGDGPSQWTPSEVSATAIWALAAKTVADSANVLGEPDDEAAYRAVYDKIRADFQRRLYDPKAATVKNNGSCQAGTSAALCIGLIPDADRDRAVRAVIEDLKARQYQQTTGEVLHVFLVRALSEFGGQDGIDALHRSYARTAKGSYGYMVATGLTTLPESWEARPGTGNSMSHLMLGQLMEWHFAYVAGLRQAPGLTGWSKAILAPQPPSAGLDGVNVTQAEASFESPRGRISARWSFQGEQFQLECTIPPGVAATINLPDGTSKEVGPGPHTLSCRRPKR